MATYTIKCFKNTGFNNIDIPDSSTRLESLATSVSFDDVWLLQDKYKTNVRVNTSYSNVKDVDYCKIGTTYYFVVGIKMLNENACELSLATDYLTTIGIANLGIVSGWCTRRSVTNDTLFSNVIDEDFIPSEPLKLDLGVVIKPNGSASSDLQVVTSTVDLSQIYTVGKTFEDTATSLSVTVPFVPRLLTESEFVMSLDTEHVNRLPNTTAYDITKSNIQDGIQAVRSLGIDTAITGSYRIPKEYISSSLIDSEGRIANVTSNNTEVESNINPVYDANVKNKKVFIGQFQRVVLTSIVSGSQEEYEAHDIYDGSGNFKFRVFADVSPEGRPFCKPTYYHGDTTNYFMGVVAGAVWQNLPISFVNRAGQSIDYVNQSRRNILSAINTGSSIIGSVMNIPNMPEITAGGTEMWALSDKQNKWAGDNINRSVSSLSALPSYILNSLEDTRQYNIRANIVAPEINFARVSSLQNYIGNYFYVYRYRLSDNDTVRFDNYLTQFGYAVNEPLTQACFTGRKHFNYVRGEGINIKNSYSLIFRDGAIRQLMNGVRVWHELPNLTAMYSNPIGG